MGSSCCKCATGNEQNNSTDKPIYSPVKKGANGVPFITGTLEMQKMEKDNSYTLMASTTSSPPSGDGQLKPETSGTDPPIFIKRIADTSVRIGTNCRLTSIIKSTEDIAVTWYRNDRRVCENDRLKFGNESNVYSLEINEVRLEDEGQWMCMAEGAGGRSTSISVVSITIPKAFKQPKFVDELQATLTEQGTVSLECKVVGVPTPTLRWFKDSKEIKAGDVFALTANPNDPTSLGVYTCEARNCMGKSYSSSKVTVAGKDKTAETLFNASGPPPIFTEELKTSSCKIGDTIVLGCQVAVPPWPVSVAWYNQEGKIEDNENYQFLEDGVGSYMVEVKSTRSCDAGDWKCVVTNMEGSVGISSCFVDIEVPNNFRKPRFMEPLRAVLTEEGLVSFECKVVGFPTPILRWYKDDIELRPGDIYQLTGINSLGSYCCVAENCMGSAKSSTLLTLEDIEAQLNDEEKSQLIEKDLPPKFSTGLKMSEARINEDFKFAVQVQSVVDTKLYWFKDDMLIEASDKYVIKQLDGGVHQLEVKNLGISDQAEWKCIAMNDFGQSMSSCLLKLLIPKHYKKPRFLESLKASLTAEGAVNLECKVIGVPQPTLKWYKDGVELKAGDIHRIISGQEGARSLGTYTCEAHNCMGTVSSSASILGYEAIQKTEYPTGTLPPVERNLSLSTINEERTSQLYETPPQNDLTINDRDISYSFDGKEVSISLYETPDLTEEEALKVVEMYADQISEHVTEQNIAELPPLRFMKETSTSGNLLMQAVLIDVAPDYFPEEEDQKTDNDMEDLSNAEGSPQLSPLPRDDQPMFTVIRDDENERDRSNYDRSENDYFSLIQSEGVSKVTSETSFETARIEKSSESGIHSKMPSPPVGKTIKDLEKIKTIIDVLALRVETEQMHLKQVDSHLGPLISCYTTVITNLKDLLELEKDYVPGITTFFNDSEHFLSNLEKTDEGITFFNTVDEPLECLLQNLEGLLPQLAATSREKQQVVDRFACVQKSIRSIRSLRNQAIQIEVEAEQNSALKLFKQVDSVAKELKKRVTEELNRNKISLGTFEHIFHSQLALPLCDVTKVLGLENQELTTALSQFLSVSKEDMARAVAKCSNNKQANKKIVTALTSIQDSINSIADVLKDGKQKSLYPLSTEALIQVTAQNNIYLGSNIANLSYALEPNVYEAMIHMQKNFEQLVDRVLKDPDTKENTVAMEMMRSPLEEINFFMRLSTEDFENYLTRDLEKPLETLIGNLETCESLVVLLNPKQPQTLKLVQKLKASVVDLQQEVKSKCIYETKQFETSEKLQQEVTKCLSKIHNILLNQPKTIKKSVLQKLMIHLSDIANARLDENQALNIKEAVKKLSTALLCVEQTSDIKNLVKNFVDVYGYVDQVYTEIEPSSNPVLGVLSNIKSAIGQILEHLAEPMEDLSAQFSSSELMYDVEQISEPLDDVTSSAERLEQAELLTHDTESAEEILLYHRILAVRNQNSNALNAIARAVQKIEEASDESTADATQVVLNCFKQMTSILVELEYFIDNLDIDSANVQVDTAQLAVLVKKQMENSLQIINNLCNLESSTVADQSSGGTLNDSFSTLENMLMNLINHVDQTNIQEIIRALTILDQPLEYTAEDQKCSEILQLAEKLIQESMPDAVGVVEMKPAESGDESTSEDGKKCTEILRLAEKLIREHMHEDESDTTSIDTMKTDQASDVDTLVDSASLKVEDVDMQASKLTAEQLKAEEIELSKSKQAESSESSLKKDAVQASELSVEQQRAQEVELAKSKKAQKSQSELQKGSNEVYELTVEQQNAYEIELAQSKQAESSESKLQKGSIESSDFSVDEQKAKEIELAKSKQAQESESKLQKISLETSQLSIEQQKATEIELSKSNQVEVSKSKLQKGAIEKSELTTEQQKAQEIELAKSKQGQSSESKLQKGFVEPCEISVEQQKANEIELAKSKAGELAESKLQKSVIESSELTVEQQKAQEIELAKSKQAEESESKLKKGSIKTSELIVEQQKAKDIELSKSKQAELAESKLQKGAIESCDLTVEQQKAKEVELSKSKQAESSQSNLQKDYVESSKLSVEQQKAQEIELTKSKHAQASESALEKSAIEALELTVEQKNAKDIELAKSKKAQLSESALQKGLIEVSELKTEQGNAKETELAKSKQAELAKSKLQKGVIESSTLTLEQQKAKDIELSKSKQAELAELQKGAIEVCELSVEQQKAQEIELAKSKQASSAESELQKGSIESSELIIEQQKTKEIELTKSKQGQSTESALQKGSIESSELIIEQQKTKEIELAKSKKAQQSQSELNKSSIEISELTVEQQKAQEIELAKSKQASSAESELQKGAIEVSKLTAEQQKAKQIELEKSKKGQESDSKLQKGVIESSGLTVEQQKAQEIELSKSKQAEIAESKLQKSSVESFDLTVEKQNAKEIELAKSKQASLAESKLQKGAIESCDLTVEQQKAQEVELSQSKAAQLAESKLQKSVIESGDLTAEQQNMKQIELAKSKQAELSESKLKKGGIKASELTVEQQKAQEIELAKCSQGQLAESALQKGSIETSEISIEQQKAKEIELAQSKKASMDDSKLQKRSIESSSLTVEQQKAQELELSTSKQGQLSESKLQKGSIQTSEISVEQQKANEIELEKSKGAQLADSALQKGSTKTSELTVEQQKAQKTDLATAKQGQSAESKLQKGTIEASKLTAEQQKSEEIELAKSKQAKLAESKIQKSAIESCELTVEQQKAHEIELSKSNIAQSADSKLQKVVMDSSEFSIEQQKAQEVELSKSKQGQSSTSGLQKGTIEASEITVKQQKAEDVELSKSKKAGIAESKLQKSLIEATELTANQKQIKESDLSTTKKPQSGVSTLSTAGVDLLDDENLTEEDLKCKEILLLAEELIQGSICVDDSKLEKLEIDEAMQKNITLEEAQGGAVKSKKSKVDEKLAKPVDSLKIEKKDKNVEVNKQQSEVSKVDKKSEKLPDEQKTKITDDKVNTETKSGAGWQQKISEEQPKKIVDVSEPKPTDALDEALRIVKLIKQESAATKDTVPKSEQENVECLDKVKIESSTAETKVLTVGDQNKQEFELNKSQKPQVGESKLQKDAMDSVDTKSAQKVELSMASKSQINDQKDSSESNAATIGQQTFVSEQQNSKLQKDLIESKTKTVDQEKTTQDSKSTTVDSKLENSFIESKEAKIESKAEPSDSALQKDVNKVSQLPIEQQKAQKTELATARQGQSSKSALQEKSIDVLELTIDQQKAKEIELSRSNQAELAQSNLQKGAVESCDLTVEQQKAQAMELTKTNKADLAESKLQKNTVDTSKISIEQQKAKEMEVAKSKQAQESESKLQKDVVEKSKLTIEQQKAEEIELSKSKQAESSQSKLQKDSIESSELTIDQLKAKETALSKSKQAQTSESNLQKCSIEASNLSVEQQKGQNIELAQSKKASKDDSKLEKDAKKPSIEKTNETKDAKDSKDSVKKTKSTKKVDSAEELSAKALEVKSESEISTTDAKIEQKIELVSEKKNDEQVESIKSNADDIKQGNDNENKNKQPAAKSKKSSIDDVQETIESNKSKTDKKEVKQDDQNKQKELDSQIKSQSELESNELKSDTSPKSDDKSEITKSKVPLTDEKKLCKDKSIDQDKKIQESQPSKTDKEKTGDSQSRKSSVGLKDGKESKDITKKSDSSENKLSEKTEILSSATEVKQQSEPESTKLKSEDKKNKDLTAKDKKSKSDMVDDKKKTQDSESNKSKLEKDTIEAKVVDQPQKVAVDEPSKPSKAATKDTHEVDSKTTDKNEKVDKDLPEKTLSVKSENETVNSDEKTVQEKSKVPQKDESKSGKKSSIDEPKSTSESKDSRASDKKQKDKKSAKATSDSVEKTDIIPPPEEFKQQNEAKATLKSDENIIDTADQSKKPQNDESKILSNSSIGSKGVDIEQKSDASNPNIDENKLANDSQDGKDSKTSVKNKKDTKKVESGLPDKNVAIQAESEALSPAEKIVDQSKMNDTKSIIEPQESKDSKTSVKKQKISKKSDKSLSPPVENKAESEQKTIQSKSVESAKSKSEQDSSAQNTDTTSKILPENVVVDKLKIDASQTQSSSAINSNDEKVKTIIEKERKLRKDSIESEMLTKSMKQQDSVSSKDTSHQIFAPIPTPRSRRHVSETKELVPYAADDKVAPERPIRTRKAYAETDFKPIAPAVRPSTPRATTPRSFARHDIDSYSPRSYTPVPSRSATSIPREFGSAFTPITPRYESYRPSGVYLSTTSRSVSREPTPIMWKSSKFIFLFLHLYQGIYDLQKECITSSFYSINGFE